jgi:hypothetical protein
MCGKESRKKPSYLGWWPFVRNTKLDPYWSHVLDQLPHFSALLRPLLGPKHSLFPIYPHKRAVNDNDDINMPYSSSVGHNTATILSYILHYIR